jgi:diguanylate cyclase (GGDEF)-like protein/PAS domain S-box-containing protein
MFVMTRLLILVSAYFLAGWFGLTLPFVGTHITLIWLPTGIAVAALIRWGCSIWPGIYLGAFLVNLFTGASWPLAAAIAIGNTLAPILTAALLNRFGFHPHFDRQKDVGLLVLASGLGMTLSALSGVSSLYLAGEMPVDHIGFAISSWWLGDTIGVLLAAPFLITLTWDNLRHLNRARTELLCWMLMAVIFAWFALIHDYGNKGHSLPLAFLTIPLLTWSGLRFGNTGAALAGLVFSLMAAWGTAIGKGGFILPDIRVSLFLLWAYMATTVLTGLLITALQAERFKIEKELWITTESLKDAQRIANIGSWRLDLLKNELSWSDEIFRLFELEPQQLPASYETFLNAIHPDDRDAVHRAYTESVLNHTPYEITHRLLMPDGRIKWVCERCRTDYDTNGRPLCSQGTVQDVTERRQADELLRKLSQAVEQSQSSIVITDLNANIEFANEAFYRETGYRSTEAIGQNPKILQSGKTSSATYLDMWAALTNGRSWKGEFINKRKDGSEYIELALISPIQQVDGCITHYLAIKDDITEQKQAEIALRDSHQQMYSLLNSMAEGAYGVDTLGNCQFVNRSFLKILGYDHEDEVIGKHSHTLIHHSHADGRPYPATECRMYEAYQRNVETHVVGEVLWRKDGVAIPVEYRSHPIITNGKVTGAIATFVDISERIKAQEVSEQAAGYARSLIEASLDPLVTISAEGIITDVNKATEQVTGITRNNLIGSDFADYFTEPDKARQSYEQVFEQGSVTNFSLVIRHISGKLTDVLYNASLYRDIKGQVLGVFAAARDISERKRFEDALRDHEERLSLATLHNGVGIWDWNLQRQEMVWDDSMYALYHIRREDFPGTEEAWRQSLHPDDLEREDKEVEEALSGEKPFDTEFRVCWPDGEIRYIKAVAKVFRDEQGKPIRMLGTNIDVTDRKLLQFNLERQAHIDYLTGVSNRRYFMEQAELELRRSIRYNNSLSILMMDIDFFKSINDSHGHKVGDTVLKKLAEVCNETLREADIVGRLGGEEFAILLPETGAPEAVEAAERLRIAIANAKIPLESGLPIHVTISMGIASLASKDDNTDVLLNLADKALYEAKESGRNKVCLAKQ